MIARLRAWWQRNRGSMEVRWDPRGHTVDDEPTPPAPVNDDEFSVRVDPAATAVLKAADAVIAEARRRMPEAGAP